MLVDTFRMDKVAWWPLPDNMNLVGKVDIVKYMTMVDSKDTVTILAKIN